MEVLEGSSWKFLKVVLGTKMLSVNFLFPPLVPVLSPREIEEKNSISSFLDIFTRPKDVIFRSQKFLQNLLAAFGA